MHHPMHMTQPTTDQFFLHAWHAVYRSEATGTRCHLEPLVGEIPNTSADVLPT